MAKKPTEQEKSLLETNELPSLPTITPEDLAPKDASEKTDPTEEEAYAALRAHRAQRRRKTLRRRGLIIGSFTAVIAISLLITYFVKSKANQDAEIGLITEFAYQGDFSTEVTADGNLKPINSTIVSPSIEGTIASVEVSMGQYVNEGDLLMTIKNDELDYEIEAKLFALQDAKKAYETLLNEAGKDDLSCISAQRDYQAAQRAYNQAVASGNQRNVYAPCSGSIVELNAQVGANLGELSSTNNSGLMQIADISQMTVQIEVGEEDIANIERGQKALLEFAAFDDLELTGEVIDIASVSTGSMGVQQSYESGNQVTYSVIILISEPDPRLKPGMTAHAKLITKSYENVIMVSSIALMTDDGKTFYVNKLIDPETQSTQQVFVDVIAQDDTTAVVGRPSEELAEDHPNKDIPVSPLFDGDELVVSGLTSPEIEGSDSEMTVN